MNYYSRAPLIRLIIPFLAGIVMAIHLPSQVPFLSEFLFILFFIYLFLVISNFLFGSYHFRPLAGIILNIYFFASAYQLSISSNDKFNASHFRHAEAQAYRATVGGEIQKKEKSVKVFLKVNSIYDGQQWHDADGKMLVYFRPDERSRQLLINDEIIFEATVSALQEPGNPGEFNYKKYLSNRQVFHQAFIDSSKWQLTGEIRGFPIFRQAQKARIAMLDIFNWYGITGKEFAVASALVLGFKDELDPDLIRAYAGAGAMHVLAVSGLHVGIIYLALDFLLGFFNRNRAGRILKAILLIAMLWIYALITGLSPSVLRAATMFTFVIAAKPFSRSASIYNSLAASAFGLLLYNPYLIMEVGFQLSYIAVFGIVYIQPKIAEWYFPRFWLDKKIWGIISVSIAAQIATFPLGLLYFHQFPNYFLFSNLLVIPGAFLILSGGLLLLIFSVIADFFNTIIPAVEIFAIGFKYVVLALNFVVEKIEKLPNSITDSVYISDLQVWLIYAMIISSLAWFAKIKPKYLLLFMLLYGGFLTDGFLRKSNHIPKKSAIIYNIKNHSAIDLVDGSENMLLSTLSLEKDYNSFQFHIRNNWVKLGLQRNEILALDSLAEFIKPKTFVKGGFIRFEDKVFFKVGPEKESYPELNPKIQLEGLIIS
ncbi:MAG: ComEC/Rec2 family competence protein, partial [Bacteroidetes bacterium]|nr:ComEC/Rec2 family competence protein [Bacteroidota bacterium]